MRRRWARLCRGALAVLAAHGVLLLCVWACLSSKKHSLFYRVDYSSVQRSEAASHRSSLDYLEQLESQLSRTGAGHVLWNEPGPKQLCIGIVTKKRQQHDYLVRSAGYLLARMGQTQLEGDRVRVFVLSTDTPGDADRPSLHLLSRIVHVVHLHSRLALQGNDTLPRTQLRGGSACLRDEVVGYSSALEYTQQRGHECSYAVLLQDDAIVSRRFLDATRRAIHSLEAEVKDTRRQDHWLGLKLFYSDTFSGWARDYSDYVLLGSTAVSGAVVVMTLLCAILQATHRRLSTPLLLVLFVHVTTLFVLVLLAAGKQNVFPPFRQRGNILLTRNSSVLVGQLYPRRQIPPLVSHLRHYVSQLDADPTAPGDSEAVDILLNAYMHSHDLDVYLLVPNPVQHVGRFSSCAWKNQGSLLALSQSNTFPKEDDVF